MSFGIIAMELNIGMRKVWKYIFGPVPSRRLGLSLGIDIVPYKSCTLDCVYCQLGRTNRKTAIRANYAPLEEVLAELRAALKRRGRIDWITFSGSGEPTLHKRLGEMIRSVKKITRIPVAVLTNGTLLWMPSVRRDLDEADLVIPDLDAGSARTFRKINRPHPSLSFKKIVEGIEKFTRRFKGKVWLEVFLARGVNDSEEELRRITRLIRRIKPDRIQINTVDRPPAEKWVRPLGAKVLRKAQSIMRSCSEGIPVEVISVFSGKKGGISSPNKRGELLKYLKRRPATLFDLSAALGISRFRIAGLLRSLLASGLVREERTRGKRFFVFSSSSGD